MKFDCFFSICQAEVNGYLPSEKTMFLNFFEQVKAADALGYNTAWIAESHLSCEVQKELAHAVIPHFKGEIGLNTDMLLIASKVFSCTQRIEVGSAIRSLLVNGGPMAHAEAVKSFLTLHGLSDSEERKIHLGFAAGRFPFSSQPYGIVPRDDFEQLVWPVLKGKIFLEATEVFLRFLKSETFSAEDLQVQTLEPQDFRTVPEWEQALQSAKIHNCVVRDGSTPSIVVKKRWQFQRSGVIPFSYPKHLLKLFVGSHDPKAQAFANTFLPCGVFNLSITPGAEIERTHQHLQKVFHADGGQWARSHMPRTVLVFLNADPQLSPAQQSTRAKEQAAAALQAYWNALEGTLDPARIANATHNALIGNPMEVLDQVRERFHPEDRLMLWFDFFNHNSAEVINNMKIFAEKIAPHFAKETEHASSATL
jgi:alkanesulfonate monooxygenase SsuD/methylene tetrahydromethanopterin reductase-like flavin-dependent oxidoreductase (luciferase family)